MMNPLIEFLKQAEGTVFVNEDGLRSEFSLSPPLGEQELATLLSHIPCKVPVDFLELLRFASGFEGTWLEQITFARVHEYFGLEEIFPQVIELAHDGLGNYWVMDLTASMTSWGPIFYVCHDAPVIVYQTDSLLHFCHEVIRDGNKPWESEISDVWGRLSNQIYSDNPGVLSFSHCIQNPDEDLKAFATSLDDTWQFIDLRNPVLGDGFSWGRYGPRTAVRRFGEKRIFAYQKKSLGRRILDGLR